jgi:anthranilate phosphoribosyltransferase
MLATALGKLSARQDLSMNEMEQIIDAVMQGSVPEPQIALLLTALHEKGESVEELAGAARAMRRHMTPIRHERVGVIDTCGPGGHGSGTFNISTAAAIVTAAAGVPVAKHGNRSITSKTGSADALAALGVNILAPVPVVETCLNEIGVCFCFAPALHSAMKHVAAVRKALPFRTIFNLLGPLCNPASAPFQLLGVGRPELRPLLARALALLGTERTVVAFAEDGLGEVSNAAVTQVTEVSRAGLKQFEWRPDEFLPTLTSRDSSAYRAIYVETAQQSAEVIRGVLNGGGGPARELVVINAAAALWTAGASDSTAECARRAAEAIDSGRAQEVLARLVEITHRT